MRTSYGDPDIYATAIPMPPPLTASATVVSSSSQNGGSRPGLPPRQPSNYSLPPFHQSNIGGREYGASTCVPINQDQLKHLRDQGFTEGLAKALSATRLTFPLRVWVVDNSGSMQKDDGHRLVETARSSHVKIVSSTRWAELQETVNYHVQLAALLASPTSFRLLNDPGIAVGAQQFGVAEAMGGNNLERDVHRAREIMRMARPGGVTPLTEHILDIQSSVSSMAPDLIQRGQRVAVIIATDGLPTDAEGYGGEYEQTRFLSALRSLEGLPLWVVIRLCTDEDEVVEFYNNLDNQLELSIEVLDDFVGEAHEVHEQNPWINYTLPLHRCREMGFHDRVFDMIDERPLTPGEVRDYCSLLFGVDHMDGVPDPAADWSSFVKDVGRMLKNERNQWDPIKKKVVPWIDLKALNKKYGDGSLCCLM